ncbi:MAG: lytic transglycosylase domain-containing protein [Chloroflexota bacterium]|nr:lytic transglycosylase domain-containing protein [Chloroflexota bacterium]
MDPQIFLRQINQESGWQVYAHSGAGAMGIAQIVPRWHPSVNPWKPYESLDYAGGLVAGHVREFGRIDYALAAYNAGGTAVREWGGIPPYPKTQKYVRSILNDWSPPMFDDMPESQAIDKWLHLQFQDLAQGVTGVVNRANAGVMPTSEEVEHANKRFADLRDNWAGLWAKEKAAAANGRDD